MENVAKWLTTLECELQEDGSQNDPEKNKLQMEEAPQHSGEE